jgi:hypothetical protein
VEYLKFVPAIPPEETSRQNAKYAVIIKSNQSWVTVSSKSSATETPMKQSQGPKSTDVHDNPQAIGSHPTPTPTPADWENLNKDVRVKVWQLSAQRVIHACHPLAWS